MGTAIPGSLRPLRGGAGWGEAAGSASREGGDAPAGPPHSYQRSWVIRENVGSTARRRELGEGSVITRPSGTRVCPTAWAVWRGELTASLLSPEWLSMCAKMSLTQFTSRRAENDTPTVSRQGGAIPNSSHGSRGPSARPAPCPVGAMRSLRTPADVMRRLPGARPQSAAQLPPSLGRVNANASPVVEAGVDLRDPLAQLRDPPALRAHRATSIAIRIRRWGGGIWRRRRRRRRCGQLPIPRLPTHVKNWKPGLPQDLEYGRENMGLREG
eukprot:gene7054-biopygen4979